MGRCRKLALAAAMVAVACSAHAEKMMKFKVTNKDDYPVTEIRVGYGNVASATYKLPMTGPLAPGQQIKGEIGLARDSSTWMFVVVVQGDYSWSYRVDDVNDFTFKAAQFTFTLENTCKTPITKLKVGKQIARHFDGGTNWGERQAGVREFPLPLPVAFGSEVKIKVPKHADIYFAWEAGKESGYGTFVPEDTNKVQTCKLGFPPGLVGK